MKNFIALLIFFLGAGAWFVVDYNKRTGSWIADVTDQTAQLEIRLAKRRADLEVIKNALDLQRRAAASREALGVINSRRQALAKEKAGLLAKQKTQDTSSRGSLVGVVLTDVVLADGRRLSQARVMKVDDTGVSFAVPSGIVRVTPKELTPEMREYFQFRQ